MAIFTTARGYLTLCADKREWDAKNAATNSWLISTVGKYQRCAERRGETFRRKTEILRIICERCTWRKRSRREGVRGRETDSESERADCEAKQDRSRYIHNDVVVHLPFVTIVLCGRGWLAQIHVCIHTHTQLYIHPDPNSSSSCVGFHHSMHAWSDRHPC